MVVISSPECIAASVKQLFDALPVHDHRAGPALSLVAALLCARQCEMLAPSASSRVVRGSTSRACSRPLTVQPHILFLHDCGFPPGYRQAPPATLAPGVAAPAVPRKNGVGDARGNEAEGSYPRLCLRLSSDCVDLSIRREHGFGVYCLGPVRACAIFHQARFRTKRDGSVLPNLLTHSLQRIGGPLLPQK